MITGEVKKRMAHTDLKKVRVYVVEEQEIYQEVYRIAFSPDDKMSSSVEMTYPVELLGVSSNSEIKAMSQAIDTVDPDVLLLSTRKITPSLVKTLDHIRKSYPGIGIAIFLMFYSTDDIELLRQVAQKGEGGMALFLKQSVAVQPN